MQYKPERRLIAFPLSSTTKALIDVSAYNLKIMDKIVFLMFNDNFPSLALMLLIIFSSCLPRSIHAKCSPAILCLLEA